MKSSVRQATEFANFTLELPFAQLWLFWDYPIMLAIHNVGEIRYNCSGVNAAELNTED